MAIIEISKWLYCVQYDDNTFVSLNTDKMNHKKVSDVKNHKRAGLNHANKCLIYYLIL